MFFFRGSFSKLLSSIGRDAKDELMQKLMIIYEGIWKRRNDTLFHTGNSTSVFSITIARSHQHYTCRKAPNVSILLLIFYLIGGFIMASCLGDLLFITLMDL